MKVKKLQVLLIFVLFGCTPGIDKIYKQIQIPGSEFMYLTSKLTLRDEIRTLQKAMKTIENDSLKLLMNSQMLKMDSLGSQCMKDSATWNISCYRPPNPCPPPPGPGCLSLAKFLIYSSLSDWGKVEIHQNGRLILVLNKGGFIDLTKIRIIPIPRKIKFKSGDVIVIKLPVEYRDESDKIHRRIIEYKETIQ